MHVIEHTWRLLRTLSYWQACKQEVQAARQELEVVRSNQVGSVCVCAVASWGLALMFEDVHVKARHYLRHRL
jgi:hypothetical protein